MITLFDDQKRLLESAAQQMRDGSKSVLIQAATGCHVLGSLILMYDGKTKRVEDIRVGDFLMGDDSTARRVMRFHRGQDEMYKITPIKGESFIVNSGHILCLKRTNAQGKTVFGHYQYKTRSKPKGHISFVSVKDYFNKSKTYKHIYKLWKTSVDFHNSESLPISPYFLGIWLGDGTSSMPAITTGDKEIAEAFADEAKIYPNLIVRVEQKENNKASTYFATTGKKGGDTRLINNQLLIRLRNLNVIKNKHIPHIYKTASRSDRLQLLAGIIDTDGSLSNGCFDYISKEVVLAEDVVFLARSIGLGATYRACEKRDQEGGGGTYYRVCISGDISLVPTRLKHKKAPDRIQKKSVLVTGFSIESVGVNNYYGFELDGNHLYLSADFTVHHNSGKSVIASELVRRAQAKGSRTWFIVPRRDLLRQMSKTYDDFNLPHGFIAAGYTPNIIMPTQICSLGTLRARNGNKAPNLAIIDETHVGGDGLDKLIKWLKASGTYIIGLSATPWKLSGQGLGCWYDTMVNGESIRWLIDNKRLCGYKPYTPDHPDLSAVGISGGDYAKGQLASFMEQDRVLIGNAVAYYKKHAEGKLNIAYCVSVKHSQMVADSFNEAGIPAAHMDGETPDDERKRIIKAYANRELKVLTNCELLTYGFDLASQVNMDVTVEAMSDLRPTKSLALQMQKWGRVLRNKPYPALIFDHANNIGEMRNGYFYPNHGLPCAERVWTLEDRTKKERKESEKILAVRQCDVCYMCHKPMPVCPNCGYVYPIQYREIEEVEGELSELDITKAKTQARKEVGMAKTVEDLWAIAKARGYRSGWVYKQMQVKGIRA